MGKMEVGLIVLWTLSPLAGQASLRILSTKQFSYCCIDAYWQTFDVLGLVFSEEPDYLPSITGSSLTASTYFRTMHWQSGCLVSFKGGADEYGLYEITFSFVFV
jgi:hypothetical protein